MKAIERLYEYLDYKKLKPTALEKEIGLSNGYISVQKKRNADMGEGALNKIIDYCRDINPLWLLTGEGSMLRADKGEKKVCSGTTIGFKRIAVFKPIEASALRLVITSCRLEPYLEIFQPYGRNGKVPAQPLTDKVAAFIRGVGQKMYYKRLNKQKQKQEI